MNVDWAMVGVLVALLSLVGPGLIFLGFKLGQLQISTRAAHTRIDRLEEQLRMEFRALNESLTTAIKDAWRNCPLATHERHKD